MIWLFWLCAVLFAWVYFGYPVVLALGSRARAPAHGDPDHRPTVTVIIAACNETRWIRDRIRNVLDADYPHDRLQLIVVSDGSDDGTTEIARSIADERLLVLEVQPRAGKANALNRAMQHTTGEIVVFSDANVLFDADGIARLAAHFADPACGAVTGRVELQALESGEPLGEGIYMKLERFLQAGESRIATVVGTDGAMFAARRSLVPQLPHNLILDDFFIAICIAGAGHRVRYEPAARAVELVPASVEQEFRRKVRIAAGCFQVLPHLEFLRHPWRQPLLWGLFVSHKLLRWLTPAFMLGMLVTSAMLADAPFWLAMFAAQVVFYGLALVGWRAPAVRRFAVVYVPYYFTAVNIAFALGLLRWLRGGQSATWQRVDRGDVPSR
ncbi:glycosyltransferase family 2 protein [Halofilum ochraceum]|uniref:glycosyltransferase family 2 protein n=1 Tax=Halofilum ochraceum TaxID=1611323 RepID=UPI0008345C77|nr:glycosyltransferase family 2 protein [Halofilum ochraceum]